MRLSMLVYSTRTVPLHEVRAGSLVEHDGQVYKVFRRVRLVRPGGWVLLGVRRNEDGGFDGESVGLLYANENASVQQVVS